MALSDDQLAAIHRVREALKTDPYYRTHPALDRPAPRRALHLAVFIEPYLSLLLGGTKTIESRFASRRFAPYEQVRPGDLLLLKKSSGPLVGVGEVTDAWFYEMNPERWAEVIERFGKELCAVDPDFSDLRTDAQYGTLFRVENVRPLQRPIPFPKRDRRGWVVLSAPPDR